MNLIDRAMQRFSDRMDKISPRRICKREGHVWAGGMLTCVHDYGDQGAFYGTRYRIMCKRCWATLADAPRSSWPGDNDYPLEDF